MKSSERLLEFALRNLFYIALFFFFDLSFLCLVQRIEEFYNS